MRDFFYNKGDIFIAVLIILAAAFVIYLRVGVIMDYSASGDNSGSLLPMPPTIGEVIDQVTGGSAAEGNAQDNDGAEGNGGADQTQPQQQENDQSAVSQQEGNPPEQNPPEQNPPEQNEDTPSQGSGQIQITVNAGDAASTIADKLLTAGAITDKQAFLADVMEQRADSRLKMGTFTIPAGASHSDIIKILTG